MPVYPTTNRLQDANIGYVTDDANPRLRKRIDKLGPCAGIGLVTILVLIGLAGSVPALGQVFSETKDGSFWWKTLLVPESQITSDGVRTVARRFLDESKTRSVARLLVVSSRQIAAWQIGSFCGGYRQWMEDYERVPKASLASADLIAIGGDVVVRLRTLGGWITTQVLRGTDPTQFAIGAARFEILSIGGRYESRFEGCGREGRVDPLVYIEARGQLSTMVCERAAAWLARRLNVDRLYVEFRNDHWFTCSPGFPVFYPYRSSLPAPSEDAYLAMPLITCSIRCDGTVHCTQNNPRSGAALPETHDLLNRLVLDPAPHAGLLHRNLPRCP